MATFTSRLKLKKPAGTENVSVADINANSDIVDAGGNGALLCTSLTRPLAPFDGMMIKETDTKLLYMYDSATAGWRLTGRTLMGAVSAYYGAFTTISSAYADVPGTILTVTLIPGPATYRFSARLHNGSSGATRTGNYKFLMDGVQIGLESTYQVTTPPNSGDTIMFEYDFTATAGSHVFKLQAIASAAASVTIINARGSVEQG